MDSPPHPPLLLLQLTSQSALQHEPSTSGKIDQPQPDIQSSDNASKQVQMQSSIEISGTKLEQSQTQPNNDYTDALGAEIVCLQSEIESYNRTINNLQNENEYLKARLEGYGERIQILLKHLFKKHGKEKETGRKENKDAVEYDELESELKKVGVLISEDTREVTNLMDLSDDSEDSDNDNTNTQELESDDEEEYAGYQTALHISRMEAFGSSSKMGSELMEVGNVIKSKSVKYCTPINGIAEKLNVFYQKETLFKEPHKSEIALNREKLDISNHNQGLQLGDSSENKSPSSSQIVLPPNPMKSQSTTSSPEIVKSSEDESKLMQRKRKRVACWHTEEEMLCALKEGMLLEAVCALFRQDWKMFRSNSSKRILALSQSDFNKLKHVAEFLMGRNVNSPNTKTIEELEKHIKGSVHFCAILVGTYSRQLFQIYKQGMDDHFC